MLNPQAPGMTPQLQFHPYAALLAVVLGLHGFRKGSLTLDGAVAAFISGYLTLGNELRVFGVALIVFYLIGSRATKGSGNLRGDSASLMVNQVKVDVKEKLEDGVDASKPAGNRNAVQVYANSFVVLVCALAFRFYHTDDYSAGLGLILPRGLRYVPSTWCVASRAQSGISRPLVFAGLGLFACCLGDTLASELGILSKAPPILITTLKPCKPGVNGGVSFLGTVCSLAGGLIMGITFVACLLIENRVGCSTHSNAWMWQLLAWGTTAGILGSLLDSILGATMQQTQYSKRSGKVLTDHSIRKFGDEDIVTLGGRDVLSNSGVNFVCGSVMAAVGLVLGTL